MPEAPVATPLTGVFPPRLVARLHRERFEGTLRLHGGGATRVLYFRRGEIASAASNADEDRLPSILIREGRLTAPQVEMARARQRPGISLGKTLIELGFLTPAELLQGARRQVRQILAAAFALREGTSQESPGPLPPEVTVLGLPVRRLIFDALLEAGDRAAVVREMGSMETVYRPADDLTQALATLRLEPQHEEVARLVDGAATLREISGRVRLDDLTVSKVVLALEILGLVERASPVEEPMPQGRRIPILVDDAEERSAEVLVAPAAASPHPPPAPAPEPEPPAVRAPAPIPRPAPFAATAPDPPPPFPVASSPPEDEDDDAPPIPPGELPAFAAPPGASTGWSVDPETGEKVHMGPIELTFDGPVVPPRDRPGSRGRLALFGSAAALVVAAILAFFALRGDGSRAPGDRVASDTHVAVPDAPAVTAAPADVAAAPSATPDDSSDTVRTGPSGPAPGEAVAPPGSSGAPQGSSAAPPHQAPAPSGRAVEPAAPPAETAPSEPAPAAGFGFGFAQRLLDAGTIDRAAETFSRALQPIPRDRYTLQMMIACEAETVRKARAGTRPDEGLFVLPIAVRGRGCYRVLWGVFESRDAASSAAIPPYFASSGVTPAVVAIDRLRPPT
jgi:hypothetical protein